MRKFRIYSIPEIPRLLFETKPLTPNTLCQTEASRRHVKPVASIHQDRVEGLSGDTTVPFKVELIDHSMKFLIFESCLA